MIKRKIRGVEGISFKYLIYLNENVLINNEYMQIKILLKRMEFLLYYTLSYLLYIESDIVFNL